jgi:hypothetical protein
MRKTVSSDAQIFLFFKQLNKKYSHERFCMTSSLWTAVKFICNKLLLYRVNDFYRQKLIRLYYDVIKDKKNIGRE